MKIGVMFGSPETTTGGNALKFYASIRLDVRRIGAIKESTPDKKGDLAVVGNRTRVKVVKNKMAPPFREVEFDILYGQGISKSAEVLDMGADVGVVQKSGAWYSVDGERIGQGRDAARQYLEEHPPLMAKLEAKLLEHFKYVGVLTIEFFVKRGKLVANEMAPRVHNSGHWTIEGAVTSQFENHVRAIAGLPLGSTAARGHSAMINLIGELPAREPLLAEPGLHWHDYGKSPRPGRKLGHVTICEPTAQKRDRRAFKALARIDRATWLALR
jgi:hypothetical protein